MDTSNRYGQGVYTTLLQDLSMLSLGDTDLKLSLACGARLIHAEKSELQTGLISYSSLQS